MNRLLVLAAILFALGLGAIAKAQVGLPFPGPGTVHSAGAAFQGVGDVVSGSLGHWGTIAYSAARRGNRMLNLCNAGVCADVNSDATTGIVPNAPTINGAPCNNSGHVCGVFKMYDDTGGTFCTGSVACDLDSSPGATQPTFLVSASGSVPGISCNGSQGIRTTLAGFAATHNQPISSAASYSIANTAATQSVSGLGTQVLQAIQSGGKPEGYAGSALFAASAISTGTFVVTTITQDGSGNGSLATNNGTPATGAMGTNNVGASDQTYFCGDGFGDPLTGTVLEAFWHPAQFTGGNVTSITANMRTNGGF